VCNCMRRIMQSSRKRSFAQATSPALAKKKKQATLSFGGKKLGISTPKESDNFYDHGSFLHGIYPDRSFFFNSNKLPLKIASFDMDWTLIRTKSGNKFPKDSNDWLMLYDDNTSASTKRKLISLHEEGYQIVVFTNQGGVAIGRQKVPDLNLKFKSIQKHVGVPIVFLASTVNSKTSGEQAEMRKPQPGMWKYLLKGIFEVEDKDIDRSASFYCGDAAGRKQVPFDDFSSDDLVFSVNLGLKFYTPEMLFKGDSLNFSPLTGLKLDVKYHSSVAEERSDAEKEEMKKIDSICQVEPQEMLVLVGSPGAGKSVLYQNYFSGHYLRINNDAMKAAGYSPKKMHNLCRSYLDDGRSVVVDNMNSNPKQRSPWLAIAKEMGVRARALILQTEKETCLQNNNFRKVKTDDIVHMSGAVSKVVIHSYFSTKGKGLIPPTKAEGFEEVIEVPYIPLKDSVLKEILRDASKNIVDKSGL